MISNEKQCQITKRNLAQFEASLEEILNIENFNDDLLKQIEANSIRAKIEDMKCELEEYDLLKNGAINNVRLYSLKDLPQILIKARIAKGWTHAMLAEKTHLKEQQIQRYESTNYISASISRLEMIMEVLGIDISPTSVQIKATEFDTGVDPVRISSYQRTLKHKKAFFSTESCSDA